MPPDPATIATTGAAYAADALPLSDLKTDAAAPFEVIDGEVRLVGSHCRSSGTTAFPPRRVCMETGATDMEPMLIGPRGRLYSFSTVHVSSSRPTPYSIGYVDFENGARVLAEIEAAPGTVLACDMPVELRADGARWFVLPLDRDDACAKEPRP